MAEESSTPAPKRRGRRPGSSTGTRSTPATRRRRQGGAELVENLNEMVNQLIKENRKLKRQLDKLGSKGTAAAGGTVEKGLRSIQRRVQRAIGSGTATRRRRSPAGSTGTTTRRRTTTATRRRTPPAAAAQG